MGPSGHGGLFFQLVFIVFFGVLPALLINTEYARFRAKQDEQDANKK
jgi:hypothetical protein